MHMLFPSLSVQICIFGIYTCVSLWHVWKGTLCFLSMASSVIYTKTIKLIVKLDSIHILVDFHKAC